MVHWLFLHLLHRRLEVWVARKVVLDLFLTPFLLVSYFPSPQIHMIRAEQEAVVTDSRSRMQQHLVVDQRQCRRVELVGAKPAAVLPYAALVTSLLLLICQLWIRSITPNASGVWVVMNRLITPLPLRTPSVMMGRSIRSIANAMPSCLVSNVPCAVDRFRPVPMARSRT